MTTLSPNTYVRTQNGSKFPPLLQVFEYLCIIFFFSLSLSVGMAWPCRLLKYSFLDSRMMLIMSSLRRSSTHIFYFMIVFMIAFLGFVVCIQFYFGYYGIQGMQHLEILCPSWLCFIKPVRCASMNRIWYVLELIRSYDQCSFRSFSVGECKNRVALYAKFCC